MIRVAMPSVAPAEKPHALHPCNNGCSREACYRRWLDDTFPSLSAMHSGNCKTELYSFQSRRVKISRKHPASASSLSLGSSEFNFCPWLCNQGLGLNPQSEERSLIRVALSPSTLLYGTYLQQHPFRVCQQSSLALECGAYWWSILLFQVLHSNSVIWARLQTHNQRTLCNTDHLYPL